MCALSQFLQPRIEQTSCEPPDDVGISFTADVLKRSRQLILVLREYVTSYTSTMVIEDERHHTLYDALLRLCIQLHPLDRPPAFIRIDPAPGFPRQQPAFGTPQNCPRTWKIRRTPIKTLWQKRLYKS